MIKQEIRIIGWDDCAFEKTSKEVLLVGVIFRGAKFIDGLLSIKIKKDGLDATKKISSAVKESRHYDQLSIIMLNGITFGGFNLVDIKKLNKEIEFPIIAVQRKKPDMEKFLSAQRIFKDYKKREIIVKNASEIYRYKKIFYQSMGLNKEGCERILDLTCIRSNIPEPIRVAHLIASGLSGESRGRA